MREFLIFDFGFWIVGSRQRDLTAHDASIHFPVSDSALAAQPA